MVFAAFESGIGKEGVAKFCEVFNMPFNMSPDTWYSHEETLSQAFQEETSVQLQKNCAEARKLAMLEEGIDDDDDDAITTVDISMTFDGTWSKCGYTAKHCIGFVVSAATRKVLDFEIISKVCCYIRVSTHIAGLAAKPKDVLDTLDLTNFGVKTLLVYWSLFRYN